jgi:hypothetical protein
MVERFHYFDGADYPGGATVIFYKNGPSLELDDEGISRVTPSNPEDRLHYMEAEVNSPMVRLQPGETHALDTHWFPTRMGKEFKTVMDPGVVGSSLEVSSTASGILLAGIFRVFVPGKLEAAIRQAWSADCKHSLASRESLGNSRTARGTQSSGTNRACFSSRDGSAGEQSGVTRRSPGPSNGQEFVRTCGSV